jgi:hypothetical protein
MKLLSEYCEGTKTAQVYDMKFGGYRIVMIDSYFGTKTEEIAETEQDAEDIAEEWVLS